MSVFDFIARGIAAVASLASGAVILAVELAILSVASPAALFGAGPLLAVPWVLPIALGKYAYYGTIDDEKIKAMRDDSPEEIELSTPKNTERQAQDKEEYVSQKPVKKPEIEIPVIPVKPPVTKPSQVASSKTEDSLPQQKSPNPTVVKIPSVAVPLTEKPVKKTQAEIPVIPVKPPITKPSQVPQQKSSNTTVVKATTIPVQLTDEDYENKYSSDKKTTPQPPPVKSTQAPTPPPVPLRPKTKKISEVSVLQSVMNVAPSTDNSKRIGNLNNRDEIAKKLMQLNKKEKDGEEWKLVAAKPNEGKDAPVIMAKGKDRLHAEPGKYLTTSSNVDALVSMLKYFELKHPGQKIKIAAQGDRKQLWEAAFQKMKAQEPNSKIKMEVTSPEAAKASTSEKKKERDQTNEHSGPRMR